jgi:glyoxylase-like metal-dependent hydrolase (beta-lactamase superfamily II)
MTDTLTATPDQTTLDHAPIAVELGNFKVTALHDGHFDLPAAFIGRPDGAPEPAADATFHLDVNAFLVQAPGRNILIDTGAGGKMGTNVNKLVPSLRAAGLTPSDIDAVLCTHIHPDHTNGLVDVDNVAIFANAQVFVHQTEIDYWLTDEQYAQAPADFRYVYDWARESFAPYEGRIVPFSSGTVVPGIDAFPLFGHTPGHSGFQIDGGGNKQLIVWGDAVHDIDLQSRFPDISVQADVSQDDARASRHSLFDRVAADDVLITGMHVTFPGFGRLRRDGAGYEYSARG